MVASGMKGCRPWPSCSKSQHIHSDVAVGDSRRLHVDCGFYNPFDFRMTSDSLDRHLPGHVSFSMGQ